MPLQERVVRYASSAGALVTEEYDWEAWYGDAGDRVVLTGRNALAFKRYFANELLKLRKEIRREYAAKRSAEDLHRDEQRDRAREREERSQLIQQLGRTSLRLRGEVPGRHRGRRPGEKRIVVPSDKSTGGEPVAEDDGDSSEDEDWETDAWSKADIEGAVDLLIEEVRGSPHAKRRKVATNMLLRLIRRHQMARDHVDLLMPSLVEKALFVDLTATRRTPETARISQLIADVVVVLPEKMSRFACAEKASRILARKFQLAALVIQAWRRLRVFKQKKAHTMPLEFRVRRRAFLLVAFMDKLEQWRRFCLSPAASLALTDKLALLRILRGLTADTNTFFRLKDRRLILENGGALAIQELALCASQDVRIVALEVLTSLASESVLQLGLLQSGILVLLSVLLRSDLVEDRCMALEIADLLASATCFVGDSASAWSKAWTKLYGAGDCGHASECPHEVNLYGASTFRRALVPELRVVDAGALVVDRRRDGGLLRWLRQQLDARDGIVRLGATMVLLKLASGICNPQIACVLEQRTLHERHSGYVEKLALRRDQFLRSLVSNLADDDTAGLPTATLQLLAQLCACKITREALIEAGLPSRIRGAVGGARGLFGLVLLSAQSERPVQPQAPNQRQARNAQSRAGEPSPLHRPLVGILELDTFASEADLRRCVESSLVALVSLKPDSVARAAMQRLAYTFGALEAVFEFLFDSAPDGWLDCVELQAVAAIVCGRASFVCGPGILSSLCREHQIRRLTEPLRLLVDDCAAQKVPESTQGLVVFAASMGCQALCAAARGSARSRLAKSLHEQGAVAQLSAAVARFAADARALHRDVGCRAAALIGSLLPYQGLEKEAVADVLSETRTEAEMEEDEDLADADEAQQQRAVIARARQNAKKAASQGTSGLGWNDLRSSLPTQEAREQARALLESCGERLLAALRVARDDEVRTSVCYALSRLAGTHAGAKRLLAMGVMEPVEAMLPGRSEVDEGRPNVEHAQRLAALPASFFTLCSAVARTWTGKLAMISSDVLRHAIDVLCLLSPEHDPRLHGEAALLVARIANANHPVHGSCNEMVLRGRYNCAGPLLGLAAGRNPGRVRLFALLALAQLAQDELLAIPKLVRAGALSTVCRIVEALETRVDPEADMLLSQALRVVHAMVTYMLGTHQGRLLEKGIEAALRRLASRKSSSATSRAASQPAVREMARSVLESLSLSLAFGPEVARKVIAAPGREPEKPLTREVLDEETLREDLTDHLRNPFGDRPELGVVYSAPTGRLHRKTDEPRLLDKTGAADHAASSPRDFGVNSSILFSGAAPSASRFRQNPGGKLDLRATRPPPRRRPSQ